MRKLPILWDFWNYQLRQFRGKIQAVDFMYLALGDRNALWLRGELCAAVLGLVVAYLNWPEGQTLTQYTWAIVGLLIVLASLLLAVRAWRSFFIQGKDLPKWSKAHKFILKGGKWIWFKEVEPPSEAYTRLDLQGGSVITSFPVNDRLVELSAASTGGPDSGEDARIPIKKKRNWEKKLFKDHLSQDRNALRKCFKERYSRPGVQIRIERALGLGHEDDRTIPLFNEQKAALLTDMETLLDSDPLPISIGRVCYYGSIVTNESVGMTRNVRRRQYEGILPALNYEAESNESDYANECRGDGKKDARGNRKEEAEEYYLGHLFPISGRRLLSLETSHLSNHIGISLLCITKDRNLVFWRQKAGFAGTVGKMTPTATGSLDWRDIRKARGEKNDLLSILRHGMLRELAEEAGCGLKKSEFRKMARNSFLILGHFRWIARGGKPEFIGLCRIPRTYNDLATDQFEVGRLSTPDLNVRSLNDWSRIHSKYVGIDSMPKPDVSLPLAVALDLVEHYLKPLKQSEMRKPTVSLQVAGVLGLVNT